MKIRSITHFLNPGWPLGENKLQQSGKFIAAARPAFEQAGFEVQTSRLATVPFPLLLSDLPAGSLTELAVALESAAHSLGFEYISLGPALPENMAHFAAIPAALAATTSAFFAGLMTAPGGEISLPAVHTCAEVIHHASSVEANGFANLRFAALANVPPGAPFFPAAYHNGDTPSFAIATEAADLAVQAFSNARTLQDARQNLVRVIEDHAQRLSSVSEELSRQSGVSFGGIDFTLAPFPEEMSSFGAAIERLGVPAVGLHGSLAAVAILVDTLDHAQYPRTGFNGLLLPLLEDALLAQRAAQGSLSIKDLLLYSTVCGTGLDTIPLPGDTSVEQLYALLLDLAALSQRLDKPLTARLMPIPGKKAGDPIGFDFAYFAKSRVLKLEAEPLEGLLANQNNRLTLSKRAK